MIRSNDKIQFFSLNLEEQIASKAKKNIKKKKPMPSYEPLTVALGVSVIPLRHEVLLPTFFQFIFIYLICCSNRGWMMKYNLHRRFVLCGTKCT
jgi:hypothetical protein